MLSVLLVVVITYYATKPLRTLAKDMQKMARLELDFDLADKPPTVCNYLLQEKEREKKRREEMRKI